MDHFYRLQTYNQCGPNDILILRSQDRHENDGWSFGLADFRLGTVKNEIPLDPPWPHCKMYRGPLMDAIYEKDFVVDMRGHTALPDVMSESNYILVSDKAKQVIEANDDFGHQFYETRFFNEQGEVVNPTPYHVMIIRRVLDIEKLGLEMDRYSLAFLPGEIEMEYLSTVLHTPELKRLIATLPWWRQHKRSHSWYLSADMLQALRDAGLTGLESYSGDKYPGRTWESISLV